MEIAVTRELPEVLEILTEFTEITEKVKLLQMSFLMNSDKPKKAKEEFRNILESLPVDLVRISIRTIFIFSCPGSSIPTLVVTNSLTDCHFRI